MPHMIDAEHDKRGECLMWFGNNNNCSCLIILLIVLLIFCGCGCGNNCGNGNVAGVSDNNCCC